MLSCVRHSLTEGARVMRSGREGGGGEEGGEGEGGGDGGEGGQQEV